MTDVRLTQEAVEMWAQGVPAMQLTQIAVEEWTTVSSITTQATVTQVGVEMWASVAVASAGGVQARAMVLA